MEAHSLSGALKLIMEQRGCSGSQLARDLGVSQSWLSYASRGKKDTSTGNAARLLASVGWELVIRPKTEDDDPVKRREFMTAAASVMFVPSPKVGPDQDPAYVRELARTVARARYEHGSGTIATTAIKHLRRIESAVTSGDRKLQEAASDLAVEAVWTLSEARGFDSAENAGRLALELAQRSKSHDAQSRAYSVLAATNVERGRADRALVYVKDGMKLRDASDSQQAWMRLRTGWTLALVRGQERASRDEIENVWKSFQDTRGFYGQSRFDVADMMGCIGLALNDLRIYGEAQAVLNEAVTLLDNSSPDLQSHFLAQQIIAALQMGSISLATNRMLTLARVAPLVNSRRLDDDLREVLATSGRWATVPEVRNARDQLKAAAASVTS